MNQFKTIIRYPIKELSKERKAQLVKLIMEEAAKIDAIRARNSK